MPDLTDPDPDRQIGRYLEGTLSAAEARALAQEALDRPDLFEELTGAAVVKKALATQPVREKLETLTAGAGGEMVRFPRKTGVLVMAGSAAAMLAVLTFYSLSRREAASAPLRPTLLRSAKPTQPVLLAGHLQAPVRSGETPTFRGDPAPERRKPQPTGAIVSLGDGIAEINLGSVDGLTKGSELAVFRNDASAEQAGRLRITAVFRERARALVIAGKAIRVNDRVQPGSGAYLAALWQQVEALSARGDLDAALEMARQALAWPGSTPAQRADAGNHLGVLYLLRGDYGRAEESLREAASAAASGDALNNLGVLAELRGDSRKARTLYEDALHAFAGAADSSNANRQAVEGNLARLTSSRQ